ncbi:MAG: MGMT family protein [Candidatus Bathyarchaeota archaeon]|nr:MGMT family protein [Candidatus Termiticorpusculum sp.]
MIQVCTQSVNGTWFAVACTERQIVAASFADIEQKALNSLLNSLPLDVPFQVLLSPSVCAKNTFTLMADVLEGKDVESSFNLATNGLSEYTVRVLKAVMQIPSGYVASYGAVAKAVGGGPRAVGNVMAGNIFVLIVPCHRVVKSDFSLGGYGGGLKIKYQLLVREKRGYLEPCDIVIKNGGVLRVYPVEVTLKNIFLL